VQIECPQDWLTESLESTGHKQASWRTDPARSGGGAAATGLKLLALSSFAETRQFDNGSAFTYDVDTCIYIRDRTMALKGPRLELTVSKWGNSLAVRLPAESARQLGVGEGDTLIAEVAAGGRLILAPEGGAIDKVDVRRLRQFVGRQKETAPVVADMRRDGRY
jgi:antitoxin component of MazEF toxin-antitoxin module